MAARPELGLKAPGAAADSSIVGTILHDASLLCEGDDELLAMVQTTFDRARCVLPPGDARRFIRRREQDLYTHLEAIGLGDRLPRVKAVYAAFWRLQAGM
jgi:hypothetical protein